MKIDPSTLISPAQSLKDGVARQAEALASVQASVMPTDRVSLSPEALAASDGVPGVDVVTSTEQAVADAAIADVGVKAAAAVMDAEQERQSALIFVLAHHGRPLD